MQRSEEVATRRLLRKVVTAVSDAEREGHLLVVAGNAEIVAAILRELPERAHARAIDVPGVRVESTPAEVKEVVETAASTLSLQLQRALVDDVLETTRSAGRACVGRERTERALEVGAVDTLIVSPAFTRAHPAVAERLVDQAFDQGAVVEKIAEAAAAELDSEGGIGARLRFAV